MASYPNAVKSFTTKNAGDTIQPAHINDLQDEIAALEDGLLNGTAPVNSSRITAPAAQISNATISSLTVSVMSIANLQTTGSTTASLNVTTGSTMAALNVTGGSTLASLNVSAACDAVRAFHAAAQSFASSGFLVLSFNQHAYQVGNSSLHSTGANSSRFFPQSSGLYMMTAQTHWTAGSSDLRVTQILLNSTTVLADFRSDVAPNSGVSHHPTAIHNCQVGDYIEVRAYHTDANAYTISSGITGCSFSMTKLR